MKVSKNQSCQEKKFNKGVTKKNQACLEKKVKHTVGIIKIKVA